MRGDQFDWIRGSGGTPSSFTGPDRDRLGSLSGRLKQNIFNPCKLSSNYIKLFIPVFFNY